MLRSGSNRRRAARPLLILRSRPAVARMEAGGFPWKEEEQLATLREEQARLLLLRDADGLVGFSHFRYILEGDCPVLYVYELQLEASVCGKGVGRHVMQLFQLGAMRRKMQFVMATVFRAQVSSDPIFFLRS